MKSYTVTRYENVTIMSCRTFEADSEEEAIELAKANPDDWEVIEHTESELCHHCSGKDIYEADEDEPND